MHWWVPADATDAGCRDAGAMTLDALTPGAGKKRMYVQLLAHDWCLKVPELGVTGVTVTDAGTTDAGMIMMKSRLTYL